MDDSQAASRTGLGMAAFLAGLAVSWAGATPPENYSTWLHAGDLFLDYSKNRMTAETIGLLTALADRADLPARIEAMWRGERINSTESRPVLHIALRMPRGTHLVVDVAGWFTDASAPERRSGLFVGVVPSRLLDTRASGAVPPDGSLVVNGLATGGLPESGVAALALNVTATEAVAPGYVTAHPRAGPARSPPPSTSSAPWRRSPTTPSSRSVTTWVCWPARGGPSTHSL